MRVPDLDIDLLRCFAAVARLGGFTTAGDELGLTQSAVSLKIRRLEERLGRRLFERTSRRVTLSQDGERLLAYAVRILDLNEEAARHLASSELAGELRLGVADYFAPHLLPALLARLTRDHPALRLSVRTDLSANLLATHDAGELDLVIAKRDQGDRRGRLIAREPMVWVAARHAVVDSGTTLPLVTMPSPCVYREAALSVLKASRWRWRIAFTGSSMLGVQAAVTAGLGAAVVGRAAALPTMRVFGVDAGLPALPEAEIAVFGEDRVRPALASLVIRTFQEGLNVSLPAAA